MKTHSFNPDTEQEDYQQALNDFGITQLISPISHDSNTEFDATWRNLGKQELESLAALLIQHLINSLDSQLIASYLKAIHHDNSDVLLGAINRKIPSPSLDLPADFPDVKKPRFLYGDKLRWIGSADDPDWGIVIGRFYSFAPHQGNWMWCYLLWLGKDSPSAAWTAADTAWEQDLMLVEEGNV